MDNVTVRPFEEGEAGDSAAWDAYVQSHPRATFFHQIGWKRVLEATFSYPSHYLVAERDGAVLGVLPLFACRSIRGKLSLYSLPHTVYGGPVGNDRETEEALVGAASTLGKELKAHTIELRNRHETLLDVEVDADCPVTFEKELPGTADEVRKTFPKKAREAINQATKRHDLQSDFGGDLDTFYGLLASSYRHLGTPVFPKRFFAAMRKEFPEESIVQVIRHGDRPVAAVYSVVYRNTMMPLYSGEAPGTKNLKASNFKYFRLMQQAVESGCERFDFGRSRANNEGVVRFKTNQGFAPEPLPYQTLELVEGAGGASANPNSGIYRKLRKVWRRLPAGLAKRIGPKVIRFFP